MKILNKEYLGETPEFLKVVYQDVTNNQATPIDIEKVLVYLPQLQELCYTNEHLSVTCLMVVDLKTSKGVDNQFKVSVELANSKGFNFYVKLENQWLADYRESFKNRSALKMVSLCFSSPNFKFRLGHLLNRRAEIYNLIEKLGYFEHDFAFNIKCRNSVYINTDNIVDFLPCRPLKLYGGAKINHITLLNVAPITPNTTELEFRVQVRTPTNEGALSSIRYANVVVKYQHKIKEGCPTDKELSYTMFDDSLSIDEAPDGGFGLKLQKILKTHDFVNAWYSEFEKRFVK